LQNLLGPVCDESGKQEKGAKGGGTRANKFQLLVGYETAGFVLAEDGVCALVRGRTGE
jgi:hypothetical protein